MSTGKGEKNPSENEVVLSENLERERERELPDRLLTVAFLSFMKKIKSLRLDVGFVVGAAQANGVANFELEGRLHFQTDLQKPLLNSSTKQIQANSSLNKEIVDLRVKTKAEIGRAVCSPRSSHERQVAQLLGRA